MVTTKKTIIIIEDDPGILDAVKLILEDAGYGVHVFSNGNPLLSGDFLIPDLFILDKQLSGVSGLDVCRFLKEKQATSNIPIIMVSASAQAAQPAITAGADAFIEKPFSMQELRELVNSLLQN